jgi:hypothetical protein
MTPNDRSRTRRMIDWIKSFWSEFDYANRRLIEIQTGIPQR